MKVFSQIFKSRLSIDGIFYAQIKKLIGYSPKDIALFQEAFTHSSMNRKNKHGATLNYERLEFLGDTILASVVSDFLYEKFPQAREGRLTKLRSKIVSRENLNSIGKSLQLTELMESPKNIKNMGSDVYGNLLEALIGAIYIETGFDKCSAFIHKKILSYHLDLDHLDRAVLSYKSLLVEWAQKNKKHLRFKIEKDAGLDPDINYSATVVFDSKPLIKARDHSKKKAEEKAARRAYYKLQIDS